MKRKKQKQLISRAFQENYRQLIQFLNNSKLPSDFYLTLIHLPILTIISDLFHHTGQGHFLRSISQLSLPNLLQNLICVYPWVSYFIKVILLTCLGLPIFLLIIVGLTTLIKIQQQDQETGYFYQIYNNSKIFKMIRLHMSVYQLAIYPIFVSFSLKFLFKQEQNYDPVFGVAFLVLSLINSLVFHYYSLQIPLNRNYLNQYNQINFPNVLAQSFILLIQLILINLTKNLVPFICCVCLFIIKFLTNRYFRYETGQFYNQTEFSVFCGISVSLASLLGYLTAQFTAMMVCSCLIIALLSRNRKNILFISQKDTEWKQIKSNEMTIDDIKYLVSKQRMAKAFQEAVIISRRKNSHRDQLVINILKNKCYCLQRQSRGSIKTANSKLLLQYEQKILQIIKKIIQIQEKAVQIINLMKIKDPKQQLLIKSVVQLIDQINQNKKRFVSCMKINAIASQLVILMQLFFRKLYNDNIFFREAKNQLIDQKNENNCKLIQKQLFNKQTVLIAVNCLEEIGKIVHVSNNLPNVLGYSSSNLIGLSINQLMPSSVRNIHDSILTKFINKFTSQVARKRPLVETYAFNREFHLEKIQIRYNFFFHSFSNFQLAGIVRKLKTEDNLILVDELGNIEGWTAQIGQIFNFDQISGIDCNSYNVMPLLPAYIKHNYSKNMCLRTIFFRLSKMKTPKLIFNDQKTDQSIQQIKKKHLQAFTNFVYNGDFIQGFLVNVQIQIIQLQTHNKIMKLIKITQIKRIQNYDKLQSAILNQQNNEIQSKNTGKGFQGQFDFSPNLIPEKSIDQSQDAEYSILKTSNKIQMFVDLNFTLDVNSPDVIDANCLKFNKDLQRFQSIYSSRSLLKIDAQQQKDSSRFTNQNLAIQSTFDPKIERKSNFILLVIFVTIITVSILIEDQVSISRAIQVLYSNKTQLGKAHRAEMIFCKSIFNINQTYISQFDSGNLMIVSQWLLKEKAYYKTYENITQQQNQFYTLNVQIPSILDLVAQFKSDSNKYKAQLIQNFYTIITLYQDLFRQYKQIWQRYIDSVKAQSMYKSIALIFGSFVYLGYFIFINKRYQNQRKMTQAFFKFEKADLNHRINSLKSITSILKQRCQQWYIDQQFLQIKKTFESELNTNTVKKQTITSNKLQASNFNSISVKKIQGNCQSQIGQKKIPQSNQLQTKLSKKRLYVIIGLISTILVTQGLFIILHIVLTNNLLNSFKIIIQKFEQANKLTVYPNLRLANLFVSAPAEIIASYEQDVRRTLEQPYQNLQQLFDLLSLSPCNNCTFMPEILSTNYRSFYSNFIQQMNSNNFDKNNLTEVYYAVDVVIQNITKSLNIKSVQNPSLIVMLYILSLVIFFVSAIIIIRDLEEQCSKLECFLKFFDMQSLIKNKHMSTIMAKNM